MIPARARTQAARSGVQRGSTIRPPYLRIEKLRHIYLHQCFHRTSLYTTLLTPRYKTEPAIKKKKNPLSFNITQLYSKTSKSNYKDIPIYHFFKTITSGGSRGGPLLNFGTARLPRLAQGLYPPLMTHRFSIIPVFNFYLTSTNENRAANFKLLTVSVLP